jgi:NAD-dependent SIR2 family protein deacetylase
MSSAPPTGEELPSLDSAIRRAAAALHDADFLFVGAGAGASADSGLAVFAQVSAMPALVALGKTYDTVASADSFRKDFDNFAGFWVTSSRAYNGASPHEGYELLRGFRDAIAHRGGEVWGDELADAFKATVGSEADGDGEFAPSPAFCCTSNVDGFFVRAGFAPADVAEIHGSARRWQCGGTVNDKPPHFPGFLKDRCCDELFDPPAILQRAELAEKDTLKLAFEPPASDEEWPPRCGRCETGRLRPNVYLFGDGSGFVDHPSVTKRARLSAWCQSVIQLQRKHGAQTDGQRGPRLVILEVGCGLRVPSIRTRCEELFVQSKDATGGHGVEFIRINPEYPENELTANGRPSIPIRNDALAALRGISAALGDVNIHDSAAAAGDAGTLPFLPAGSEVWNAKP